MNERYKKIAKRVWWEVMIPNHGMKTEPEILVMIEKIIQEELGDLTIVQSLAKANKIKEKKGFQTVPPSLRY